MKKVGRGKITGIVPIGFLKRLLGLEKATEEKKNKESQRKS